MLSLIYVVFEVRDLVVNQNQITFALVSRRNISRTGKRTYFILYNIFSYRR